MTKRLLNRKIFNVIRLSALFFLFQMTSGCFPKGKFDKQPQPIKIQADTSKGEATNINLLDSGIPKFCNYIIKSNQLSCLECTVKGVFSQRCFETFEPINPLKVCKSNTQYLKCLISKGPIVVYLEFGKTLEDEFIKDMSAMVDSLNNVVVQDEKLSKVGRSNFLALLKFVETSQNNFFNEQALFSEFSAIRDKICAKQSCDQNKIDAIFKENIVLIKKNQSEGTLTLKDGLMLLNKIIPLLIPEKGAIDIISNINIDGLIYN